LQAWPEQVNAVYPELQTHPPVDVQVLLAGHHSLLPQETTSNAAFVPQDPVTVEPQTPLLAHVLPGQQTTVLPPGP
jgi:hypothetical protein